MTSTIAKRALTVVLVLGGLLVALAQAESKCYTIPGDDGNTESFNVGGRTSDYHQISVVGDGRMTISFANDGTGAPGVSNTIRIIIIGGNSQPYYRTLYQGQNGYVGFRVHDGDSYTIQIDNERNLLSTYYRLLIGFASPN